MVVKAGLGLIGLSAISVGGVAVTKPGWLGMDTQPKSTTLDQDHDYSTKKSEYQNKFGGPNASKLVGVSGKKADENKDWWEWSFRRLQAAGIEEGKFAVKGKGGSSDNIKVTKGYAKTGDTDLEKALNQVCYAVYKEDSSKIKENGTPGADEYQASEVWKYCARTGTQETSATE